VDDGKGDGAAALRRMARTLVAALAAERRSDAGRRAAAKGSAAKYASHWLCNRRGIRHRLTRLEFPYLAEVCG